MGVPYSWKIATNSPTAFLRLLLRWKGTIYRYILFDFSVFMIVYGLVSITYRYLMSEENRRLFEYYCLYCGKCGRLLPVVLVLGFFVNKVVGRWWEVFRNLPWPDETVMLLSACVKENSPHAKACMKTVLRYVHLSYILTFRIFCSRVRERYPVDQSLLADGLITPRDLKLMKSTALKGKPTFWGSPLVWAVEFVLDMRAHGLIISDRDTELLVHKLSDFRLHLSKMVIFYLVPIPLGISHVATLTVYFYFIASIFSWQFLDPVKRYPNMVIDIHIPVFGILQMFFYLGLLRVAEALINPFGHDVDDFPIDEILKRNLQVSNFLIEKLHDVVPPLASGVILPSTKPTVERGRTSVDLPSPPRGLLSHQSISDEGSNLFIGSCVNLRCDSSASLEIPMRSHNSTSNLPRRQFNSDEMVRCVR